MIKTKSKTSEKRQNKGHHIDVRFTEEEYNQIITNANKCGMHKSNYVHNAVFPVFVIGTPKFQDWVAISIKS